MSFLKYAQLFIPELTNLPVTVCGEEEDALGAFAERSCFSREIQPLYTEDGFRAFFAQKEPDRIYEITDALETRMIVFSANGQTVIFGLYVNTPWEKPSAKILQFCFLTVSHQTRSRLDQPFTASGIHKTPSKTGIVSSK